MQVTPITRKFKYGSLTLTDPLATLNLDQVRAIHAATHPELNTATLDGPFIKGSTATYEYRRAVRTKG